MPRRGRKRKKTRTHVVETDARITSALHSNDELKIPRSLVIRRGKTESELIELVSDMRKFMRPHTAVNFKEDASNRKLKLSHYASSLTGSLGITHILALSQNSSKITLRICRSPSGPTLSFRVKRFTLGRQIRSVQRRPYDSIKAYDSPPIVVTNNFGDVTAPPHVKLMRITFQNMFPPINVSTVKLGECRRVVLFNFIRRDNPSTPTDESDKNNNSNIDDDLEDEEVEVRHYAIRTKPVGIDRKVRRLIEAKIPNLSKLNDIADYITNDHGGTVGGGSGSGSGNMSTGEISDSEAEDETAHVIFPLSKKKGKKMKTSSSSISSTSTTSNNKSALKLIELGPRLRLKLYKVERGLSSGDVMYHAYVHKSPTEVAELKARKEAEATLKKRRREEQEANVARKKRVQEEKKEARELRRKEREERAMAELRGEGGGVGGDREDDSEDDDDDDEISDGEDVVDDSESEEEDDGDDEGDHADEESDSSGSEDHERDSEEEEDAEDEDD